MRVTKLLPETPDPDQEIRDSVAADLATFNATTQPQYNKLVSAYAEKRKNREDDSVERMQLHQFAQDCARTRSIIVKPLLDVEMRRSMKMTMVPETAEDHLFLETFRQKGDSP